MNKGQTRRYCLSSRQAKFAKRIHAGVVISCVGRGVSIDDDNGSEQLGGAPAVEN